MKMDHGGDPSSISASDHPTSLYRGDAHDRGEAIRRMWRILLVDDNLAARGAITGALSRAGFNTALLGGAGEAVDLLRRARFDAVIVSRELGQREGEALLEDAASLQPRALRILITNDGTLDFEWLRRRAIFHEYLLRPLDPLNLVRTLHRARAVNNARS
jgi:DNA-binding NtrC family response regulator